MGTSNPAFHLLCSLLFSLTKILLTLADSLGQSLPIFELVTDIKTSLVSLLRLDQSSFNQDVNVLPLHFSFFYFNLKFFASKTSPFTILTKAVIAYSFGMHEYNEISQTVQEDQSSTTKKIRSSSY